MCVFYRILLLCMSYQMKSHSISQLEAKGLVSLTVEGGVSLVGPHCPGTVRLFCEGVDLRSLGWTFNGDRLIVDRVLPDHVTLTPMSPANSAFVSVHITNVSIVSIDNVTHLANFSSVLTVDPLELSKQDVQNITCGDLATKDTLQVKVKDYFTPNVTASYLSGVLNRIEVYWTNLVG